MINFAQLLQKTKEHINMEIEGKIILDLPLQSGTSRAGNPWKKKEWVLETFGNYPKKIKVQAFGDRSDALHLEVGKDYRLGIDIESREFNGRWFTDVSVFSANEIQGQQQNMQAQSFGQDNGGAYMQQGGGFQPAGGFGAQTAPTFDSTPSRSDEDLPF